jgi:hypothetical protein
MEKKLEKKCSVNEFEVGSKYRLYSLTFYVMDINYEKSLVRVKWNNDGSIGLIYRNTEFYAHNVPLSSLEKELL